MSYAGSAEADVQLVTDTVDFSMADDNVVFAADAALAWAAKARPDQLPPSAYFTWLLLGGRGSGKTRAGAENIWPEAAIFGQRIAVIGPTSGDVRKTCFEGDSGLVSVIPQELIKNYNRSSLEMWLKPGINGKSAYFVGYSSEEPERLRGPQHHRAWCDELGAWRYPDDTWDMMMFGLRLGKDPSVVVTTTPRPIKLLRDLLAADDTMVSRVSTFANSANLPKKILDKLRKKYEGTRLGRQELFAELIDENPYALWKLDCIEETRIRRDVEYERVVVAVDPPVSSTEESDECGIVCCGKARDQGYVLADASCQGLSPEGWAGRAVQLYRDRSADAIVAEVNQGGDMVESVIHQVDPNVPVIKVHATRGKVVRAEPISAMYEQKRWHHVGTFAELEDQMCDFTSDFDKKIKGYSPDRVDALVWAGFDLFIAPDGKKGRAGALF